MTLRLRARAPVGTSSSLSLSLSSPNTFRNSSGAECKYVPTKPSPPEHVVWVTFALFTLRATPKSHRRGRYITSESEEGLCRVLKPVAVCCMKMDCDKP